LKQTTTAQQPTAVSGVFQCLETPTRPALVGRVSGNVKLDAAKGQRMSRQPTSQPPQNAEPGNGRILQAVAQIHDRISEQNRRLGRLSERTRDIPKMSKSLQDIYVRQQVCQANLRARARNTAVLWSVLVMLLGWFAAPLVLDHLRGRLGQIPTPQAAAERPKTSNAYARPHATPPTHQNAPRGAEVIP